MCLAQLGNHPFLSYFTVKAGLASLIIKIWVTIKDCEGKRVDWLEYLIRYYECSGGVVRIMLLIRLVMVMAELMMMMVMVAKIVLVMTMVHGDDDDSEDGKGGEGRWVDAGLLCGKRRLALEMLLQ